MCAEITSEPEEAKAWKLSYYFLLEQILSCLSWCKNSAESGRVILFFTTIGLIGMYISALSFLFAERTRSGFTSAR